MKFPLTSWQIYMSRPPGHSAQNCTYSSMAESTKEIINVVTLDKSEMGGSCVERDALIQTVEKLYTEINLVEFCTDANVHVGALMSECT